MLYPKVDARREPASPRPGTVGTGSTGNSRPPMPAVRQRRWLLPASSRGMTGARQRGLLTAPAARQGLPAEPGGAHLRHACVVEADASQALESGYGVDARVGHAGVAVEE